ncbi:hypothetical protein [Siphonobacter sp. SORGH_AS_1065]|uniref:hypothetical protein n=1 Tax=Siphonobacter sp. SORGH_AS_1065 TaxID=3041795 RepID=UPI00278B5FEF|nr:hypothetical protein [Siphonobacter sp. SORGH_AS_1065]MDQ1086177.1 hypothetical protein [Siphonobacter sp. SORGH_AS_1065]
MSPNSDFKTNLVSCLDSDVTEEETNAWPSIELHHPDERVRNVCFCLNSGRKAFFNYAYLARVDLIPHNDHQMMTLHFSSYQVELKGYPLNALFDLFMDHLPKNIHIISPRYEFNNQPHVTDIVVK